MADTPVSARDDWDRHWIEYAEANAHNPAQEYRRRLVLSLLRDPERILDIGCGSGELASDLRGRFPAAEILGLDTSAAAVEIARRKVPGASFEQRDLLADTEPEARFSGWATHAVCSEVLEHIEEPAALLRNVTPYLASGCVLVVTVPGGPMSAFDRHIGHRAHFEPERLAEVLRDAGFDVERAVAAGFPFFNLYRLAVIASGKRLVENFASGGEPSALESVGTRVFGGLFRLNLTKSPWGWQTVAVARLG
jgi:trans-aconitate methyltransferase